jgi:hypothetical protein
MWRTGAPPAMHAAAEPASDRQRAAGAAGAGAGATARREREVGVAAALFCRGARRWVGGEVGQGGCLTHAVPRTWRRRESLGRDRWGRGRDGEHWGSWFLSSRFVLILRCGRNYNLELWRCVQPSRTIRPLSRRGAGPSVRTGQARRGGSNRDRRSAEREARAAGRHLVPNSKT